MRERKRRIRNTHWEKTRSDSEREKEFICAETFAEPDVERDTASMGCDVSRVERTHTYRIVFRKCDCRLAGNAGDGTGEPSFVRKRIVGERAFAENDVEASLGISARPFLDDISGDYGNRMGDFFREDGLRVEMGTGGGEYRFGMDADLWVGVADEEID